MVEIRRLLCPVDFSDASRHALNHATTLAGWYGSHITALHVRHPAFQVEPPLFFAEQAEPPLTLESLEARLREWLEPARSAGIPCDVVVAEGANTAARIVEQADALPADLIVAGTHGRGGFERFLLGSVTEKVVRTAKCPVFTVPPPAVSTSQLPFKRLLCAVDFSEPSLSAVKYALSIAKESDAHLTLAHVVEFLDFEDDLSERAFDLARYREVVETDSKRRLDALVTDDVRTWCQPETKLLHGRAYEQILATAAAEHDDLIVMGVHGRAAIDELLFGSTTNQVVRRATCPVLTLNR
ncbi:MAG: universal stress protein [Vicinamibacterales bacterium]